MPYLWDLAVLIIVIVFVRTASRRGFLATAAHLAGSIAALGVSLIYSHPIAQSLYERLFRDRLTGAMIQTLETAGESSAEVFQAAVQSALTQLPAFLAQAVSPDTALLLDGWYDSLVDNNAAGVGATLADSVVGPAVVGLLQVVVFFVLFALCMVVVGLISGLLRGVNRIPLIGSLNGFLGGALGLVQGLLYVFVGAALVWLLISSTGDTLPDFISTDVIGRSLLFRRFFFAGPWAGGLPSL